MDSTQTRPLWRPVRPSDDTPPRRPRSLDPAELRFTPQPAVRWYSPGVLAGSGMHVGLSSVFGSFLDKRELQARKDPTIDRTYATRDELWIDYAADTGDGFAATMTVAAHLARRSLAVDVGGAEQALPRGVMLVLGGDEVYPSASAGAYEDRLEGPFRAALPWTVGEHPALYAIPGNHDWHDGLTGFLRLFTQRRWVGGWTTRQSRSYFAVKLPHNWWLWGVGIQLDMFVDEPQLEFFGKVLAESSPGDKLILATPVPTWTELERDPRAYHNLAFIERTLLRPYGIDLKLTLAGDRHHYTRYSQQPPADGPAGRDGTRGGNGDGDGRRASSPAHKITSGGGGAFLHPTHDLRRDIEIAVDPDDPRDRVAYRMQTAYPDRTRSRWLSLRALGLGWRNPSFTFVPAAVTVALLWTNQFGLRSLGGTNETFAAAGRRWSWSDLFTGLFRNPLSAMIVAVVFLGLWAFARTPPWAPSGIARTVAKTVMAAVHTGLHVLAVVAVSVLAVNLADALTASDDAWFTAIASIVAFVAGGVAGSLAVGVYLAAANGLPGIRTHGNEAFASARISGHKNFLRMHLDRQGRLTVYALGIDRPIPRHHWRADPDNDDPEAAWVVPAGGEGELRPHLIERIVVE